MSEWQPIETAPKDGTDVLLWVPRYNKPVFLGNYVDREEYEYGKLKRRHQHWYLGVTAWFPDDAHPEPSHWMPLPDAP